MSTLHCMLENGADLYINECQKIRHYCTRYAEERRRMPNQVVRRVCKLHYYSDVIYSFYWKSAVEHDGGV